MSGSSPIEWTDATWNPLRGCSKVDLDCRNCYAERIAARFDRPGLAYEGTTTDGKWNGSVVLVDEVLNEPLRWRRPRMVFVNSMSDVWAPGVPFSFIMAMFAVMATCAQHTFQILTKRPATAAKWFSDLHAIASTVRGKRPGREIDREDTIEWKISHLLAGAAITRHGVRIDTPTSVGVSAGNVDAWPLPNVWIGTSVGHAAAMHRIDELRAVPAAVRFLSLEPLHGPLPDLDLTGIDWVIVGGESGPNARPMHPDWARDIRDQCLAANVPFFFKQWGAWVDLGDAHDIASDHGRPGGVGASRKPPGGTRRPPFWESVDPCITEALRLYALGLRRPVTEEGER